MIRDLKKVLDTEEKVLIILSNSQDAFSQVQRLSVPWKEWNQSTYQWAMGNSADSQVNIWVFEGDFEAFLSIFEDGEPEESCRVFNDLISGAVAEYKAEYWDVFTCNLAVMACCVGKYLKVVNRKEWKK